MIKSFEMNARSMCFNVSLNANVIYNNGTKVFAKAFINYNEVDSRLLYQMIKWTGS